MCRLFKRKVSDTAALTSGRLRKAGIYIYCFILTVTVIETIVILSVQFIGQVTVSLLGILAKIKV